MRPQARQTMLATFASLLTSITGCTYTASFPPAKRDLSPVYSLPPLNIALSSELRNLSNRTTFLGEQCVFPIGDLLRRVFDGGENAVARVELVQSEMSVHANDVGIFLTNWNTTHTFSVGLIMRDKKFVLRVTGQGSAFSGQVASGRIAVENAVLSIYKDAQALIETGDSEPGTPRSKGAGN